MASKPTAKRKAPAKKAPTVPMRVAQGTALFVRGGRPSSRKDPKSGATVTIWHEEAVDPELEQAFREWWEEFDERASHAVRDFGPAHLVPLFSLIHVLARRAAVIRDGTQSQRSTVGLYGNALFRLSKLVHKAMKGGRVTPRDSDLGAHVPVPALPAFAFWRRLTAALANSKKATLSALGEPFSTSAATIFQRIFVDPAEFSSWAVAEGIVVPGEIDALLTAPATTVQSKTTKSAAKPVSRHKAQEGAILQALREMGYDPLALPRPTRAGGPKKEARDRIGADLGTFQSSGVFDKAWERLLKQPCRIAYKA